MKTNKISFTRGDTYLISRIFKDKNGNVLILNPETDKINFTVRRYLNEDVILEKHIEDISETDGKYTITILPTETENLNFGTYGYDIEIRIGEDFVQTVESGTFELLEYDYSRPSEVL